MTRVSGGQGHEADPIRVLLSIRTLSGAGAELVVESLATGLDRTRFTVAVCEGVGTGQKAQRLRNEGFDVVSLLPAGHPRKSYLNALRLRRVVAKKRIDVVHSHAASSLTDAALCKLTYPRLKVVHTFHFGNYPHVGPHTALMERYCARFADALVAVGQVQNDAIRKTYHFDVSRVRTIWNGVSRRPVRVDRARLDPVRARGRIIVGAVGTLIEQKGYFDLVEVAAKLKRRGIEPQFVVAGDGPLHGALVQRSRDLGVADCVEFFGWVPDAAETVLPGVDIFFQPSRWEAMSMVLLEAAALGLPILCTDVGEAARVLERDEHALIVAPGDTEMMADALQRLIEDSTLRVRLGEAAKARVMECCSAESMVRAYEQLYLSVLQPRSRWQGRLWTRQG